MDCKFPAIPGYRLLEKLGEGGMGQVFAAHDETRNRKVALKVLTAGQAGQDEWHVMASLHHPYVVKVYAAGEVEDRVYLVIEYIDGPSLRAFLDTGKPCHAKAAATLLRRICEALSYIHSQGILHLDLKPENVLLQWESPTPRDSRALIDSVPKITDFGLAKPKREGLQTSELGHVQGTIDYCAPELRHGLPVDVRTDLFALATMAYEMLTGRLPGRVYYSAAQRNPLLPPRVDDVLSRGLARDPAERHEDVAAFGLELESALREGS